MHNKRTFTFKYSFWWLCHGLVDVIYCRLQFVSFYTKSKSSLSSRYSTCTTVLWFYVQSGWSLILQITRRVQWVKKPSLMQKLVLSYLCYNTVYPGFFASHKIWKNGKMCSILICVGHFCDLKGFLLKIIQNLISAHSIIYDL